MGIENGNLFFGENYTRCQSGIESFEVVYRTNGAAVEGLDDRNGHRRRVVGEGKVLVVEVHGPKVRGASAKPKDQ